MRLEQRKWQRHRALGNVKMRRKKANPPQKQLRAIKVPPDLREYMAETFALYEGGWEDLPYIDDCLQGSLVGGKVKGHKKPYRFRYPYGGVYWKLAFDHTQIEDIGDGLITEIKLYFCKDQECNFACSLPDETCGTCDWEPIPGVDA